MAALSLLLLAGCAVPVADYDGYGGYGGPGYGATYPTAPYYVVPADPAWVYGPPPVVVREQFWIGPRWREPPRWDGRREPPPRLHRPDRPPEPGPHARPPQAHGDRPAARPPGASAAPREWQRRPRPADADADGDRRQRGERGPSR